MISCFSGSGYDLPLAMRPISLIMLFLLHVISLKSQQKFPVVGLFAQSYETKKTKNEGEYFNPYFSFNIMNNSIGKVIVEKRAQKIFRPNLAHLRWGWFCHFEHQLRRQTGLPVYLRLGSKSGVDYLEGKHLKP